MHDFYIKVKKSSYVHSLKGKLLKVFNNTPTGASTNPKNFGLNKNWNWNSTSTLEILL